MLGKICCEAMFNVFQFVRSSLYFSESKLHSSIKEKFKVQKECEKSVGQQYIKTQLNSLKIRTTSVKTDVFAYLRLRITFLLVSA